MRIFSRGRCFSIAVASAAALLGVLCVGHPFLLRGLGGYLVMEESLEQVPVIVVLAGEAPFRAMEAAELYRGGWAPKIILTAGKKDEAYYALESLGIKPPDYNREVLLRLGIPNDSILLLNEEVENTVQELDAVIRLVRANGWNRVIIVTSKAHSRRSAEIWNYLSRGGPKIIVRWAKQDPFVVDGWWERRGFAFVVLREYLGLMNLWLGLPMG